VNVPAQPRHAVSPLVAIAARDVTKLLRDRTRLLVSLAFPVLIFVGLGNLLQPTVGRATGLNAVTLIFTGVLAATLFQSAAAGMMSLIEDRETDFAREMFVAPISRLTIVSGKVAGESLVALVQGFGVVLFGLAFGVRFDAQQLGLLAAVGIAASVVGAAFGLATLAALPNQRAALQVMPFVVLPQYFLAGVLAPLKGVPTYLDALAWAMPLRYPVNLARAAFYAGQPGYRAAVSESPGLDVVITVGLVVLLLLLGAALFERRERGR
jgi:ABC-2 type transport system permease protein